MNPYVCQTWEHQPMTLAASIFPDGFTGTSRRFGADGDQYCFELQLTEKSVLQLQPGYFIGVDWLIEGHSAVVISPKLDTRPTTFPGEVPPPTAANKQPPVRIDYLFMLQQCLQYGELYQHIDQLTHIDWQAPAIPIKQDQDWLSPLLILRFVNTLAKIVRKGLKNDYYPVVQNLQNRIKGKILVSRHIKSNTVRNRLTHVVCQYQEFGVDHLENRILKKALIFATTYLHQHSKVFGAGYPALAEMVRFCNAPFDKVGNEVPGIEIRQHKPNPLFQEYATGIHIARLLLKRFGYNIQQANLETVPTPPYWIDMPRLFELYTYHLLKQWFPLKEQLVYHVSTYGNELDFLINTPQLQMVVDAKYKPQYNSKKIHKDIRQVAGYARLEKVRKILQRSPEDNRAIDCLIIYPDIHQEAGVVAGPMRPFTMEPIQQYYKVFKKAVPLPVITVSG